MRLVYFSNPNSKYNKKQFVDSLTNFGSRTHGSSLGSRPGYQIKRLLPTLAQNKPRSVSYTNWLLYNYGYKYCSDCDQVLETTSFSSNVTNWNKLSSICKSCDNSRGYQYKSTNKDKVKESYAVWYEDNREIRAAASARRRAARLKATPLWLDASQKAEILDIYKKARQLQDSTGIKHHVDHIVPLQGANVCGLHVPWNLQVITASENLHKSNKYKDESWV